MNTKLIVGTAVIALSCAATGARAQYKFTDFGTFFPGETLGWAYGINATGQVVGSSQLSDGAWGGFLYCNGAMVNLGPLSPMGINDGGQIVGAFETRRRRPRLPLQ